MRRSGYSTSFPAPHQRGCGVAELDPCRPGGSRLLVDHVALVLVPGRGAVRETADGHPQHDSRRVRSGHHGQGVDAVHPARPGRPTATACPAPSGPRRCPAGGRTAPRSRRARGTPRSREAGRGRSRAPPASPRWTGARRRSAPPPDPASARIPRRRSRPLSCTGRRRTGRTGTAGGRAGLHRARLASFRPGARAAGAAAEPWTARRSGRCSSCGSRRRRPVRSTRWSSGRRVPSPTRAAWTASTPRRQGRTAGVLPVRRAASSRSPPAVRRPGDAWAYVAVRPLPAAVTGREPPLGLQSTP